MMLTKIQAQGRIWAGRQRYNMPFTELKFQHYCAIRDFMEDIELDPEDAITPMEGEALAIVKQIILNIEKRRAQPASKPKYKRNKTPIAGTRPRL